MRKLASALLVLIAATVRAWAGIRDVVDAYRRERLRERARKLQGRRRAK
jgi:succinate dehydrogenase hydrophobic anchor subunit